MSSGTDDETCKDCKRRERYCTCPKTTLLNARPCTQCNRLNCRCTYTAEELRERLEAGVCGMCNHIPCDCVTLTPPSVNPLGFTSLPYPNCPICGTALELGKTYFGFCSKECCTLWVHKGKVEDTMSTENKLDILSERLFKLEATLAKGFDNVLNALTFVMKDDDTPAVDSYVHRIEALEKVCNLAKIRMDSHKAFMVEQMERVDAIQNGTGIHKIDEILSRLDALEKDGEFHARLTRAEDVILQQAGKIEELTLKYQQLDEGFSMRIYNLEANPVTNIEEAIGRIVTNFMENKGKRILTDLVDDKVDEFSSTIEDKVKEAADEFDFEQLAKDAIEEAVNNATVGITVEF